MSPSYFAEWTWRTLLKIIFFSIMVGSLWSLVPLVMQLGGDSDTINISDFRYIISYILDTTIIFFLVFISFMLGIAIHTWGAVSVIMSAGRKQITTGFLWAVFLSLTVNLIVTNVMIRIGVAPVSPGSIMLTASLTSIVALSTSWSVYYKYGVLDRSGRSDLEHDIASRSTAKKVLSVFIPMKRRDKMSIGLLTAPVIIVVSIWLGTLWSASSNMLYFRSVSIAASIGLLFGLQAIVIRVFDAMRPGSKRNSLYPHFE